MRSTTKASLGNGHGGDVSIGATPAVAPQVVTRHRRDAVPIKRDSVPAPGSAAAEESLRSMAILRALSRWKHLAPNEIAVRSVNASLAPGGGIGSRRRGAMPPSGRVAVAVAIVRA